MKHKLFVYGTLRPKDKSGTIVPPSHHLHGYAMYDYGRFPFIIHTGNNADLVQGNLLTVSNRELKELDLYENVASGLYSREIVEVLGIHTIETIKAFVYVGNSQLVPARIKSGDWFSHSQ